jgi:acetolactate synthase-1/2/3 large subunit
MISYNKLDFAKNAYKIVVDIDAAELRKPTLKVDLPVHADLRDVVERMLHGAYQAAEHHRKWLAWCRAIDAKYPATLPGYYDHSKPLNPYAFTTELFRVLDTDDRVICGNGSACVITFQAAEIRQGMRLFTNSGCASMGYGLPAAIGVSVATCNERVVCIDGDGSIQMNLQELQTIVQYRLNLKTFVINNNGYHSIRQTQTNLFQPPLVGVSADNGVSFPDFGKLAWAYGIRYVRIDSLEGLEEKLQEVLCGDDAVLCEVIVDETQFFAPKLSSKVLPDGRIVSPSLDDMFPFLPKEEYEENKKPLRGELE